MYKALREARTLYSEWLEDIKGKLADELQLKRLSPIALGAISAHCWTHDDLFYTVLEDLLFSPLYDKGFQLETPIDDGIIRYLLVRIQDQQVVHEYFPYGRDKQIAAKVKEALAEQPLTYKDLCNATGNKKVEEQTRLVSVLAYLQKTNQIILNGAQYHLSNERRNTEPTTADPQGDRWQQSPELATTAEVLP